MGGNCNRSTFLFVYIRKTKGECLMIKIITIWILLFVFLFAACSTKPPKRTGHSEPTVLRMQHMEEVEHNVEDFLKEQDDPVGIRHIEFPNGTSDGIE